jgi:hypothetical protein
MGILMPCPVPRTDSQPHRSPTATHAGGAPPPTNRRGISPIGLFNGAPDLAERSEEILREEFAKRRY